jgi:putative FmdB family regulatory protein
MPIYEFYCHQCNTVYSFFSKTANTEKIPMCPKCKDIALKRQMSIFATVSRGKEGSEEDNRPPFDESKMERALSMLAEEGENINDEDPRQAAMLIRKLSDVTGLNMGPGMEEALNRMERGEDPEKIEDEMGDLLAGEEALLFGEKATKGGKQQKPLVDEKLYDL